MTTPAKKHGAVDIALYLPNLDGGGAERAIVSVANGFAELGLRVALVLGEAAGPYLSEVSPKVTIVGLSSRGKLSGVLRLAKYLRQQNPPRIMSALDLPNIQLVVAARLARYSGRLFISQRATIAPAYGDVHWLRRRAYLLAIRSTYKFADSIISNSHAATSELTAQYAIPASRVVTIQNQIDIERVNRLSNESVSDAWLSRSKTPLIMSIGSLTPRKGMETLVKAVALVRETRDVRLVVLGDGPERERLEHLAAELSISADVYLPGFDVNPYKWMRLSDVLVSASRAEGFPNVVAEALALGTKVVATDCPGDTGALLEHGRWGWLVPVGDAASMASAILMSLDERNPPDGRIRAADFSPEKTIGAYLDALLPEFGSRLS